MYVLVVIFINIFYIITVSYELNFNELKSYFCVLFSDIDFQAENVLKRTKIDNNTNR